VVVLVVLAVVDVVLVGPIVVVVGTVVVLIGTVVVVGGTVVVLDGDGGIGANTCDVSCAGPMSPFTVGPRSGTIGEVIFSPTSAPCPTGYAIAGPSPRAYVEASTSSQMSQTSIPTVSGLDSAS